MVFSPNFFACFRAWGCSTEKNDRQVQHLLQVCKILEIALNNALGLDYLYTDAYSEAEKEYEAEEAKRNTDNK